MALIGVVKIIPLSVPDPYGSALWETSTEPD